MEPIQWAALFVGLLAVAYLFRLEWKERNTPPAPPANTEGTRSS